MKNLLFGKKELVCLSLLFLALAGCTNENDNPADGQREFGVTNFSNTGCKSAIRTRGERSNGYFELTATKNGGLYVKHVNVYFNCASTRFDARVNIEGQSITVTELDITNSEIMANCICPYDLAYEIGPLENGMTYSMTVITTSAPGIDDPSFVVDSEETTFSFVYSPTLSTIVQQD